MAIKSLAAPALLALLIAAAVARPDAADDESNMMKADMMMTTDMMKTDMMKTDMMKTDMMKTDMMKTDMMKTDMMKGNMMGGSTCNGNTAKYKVTFASFWKELDNMAPFGTEHFSPVVAWSHDGSPKGMIWGNTMMSTEGIENMAETGSTTKLKSELEMLATSGVVSDQQIATGGLFTPFSESWMITVDQSHPYSSTVTMVAPSPDWFIGVHLKLMNEDGSWLESEVLNLDKYVWDAGTETGNDFTIRNAPEGQHMPISLLEARTLMGGAGTLMFDLEECMM